MHHFLDSNTLLYTVEFKSNRRDICYIMQGDAFAPPLESLVLVEADRGRDLGKVVQVATANDLLENQQHDPSTLKSHVKRLFRMAEPGEIQSLKAKEKEEDQAVAFCQAKIKEKDLPMEVVSAEFQWDRRKLTFYFKADQRIDFRELVRELFKTYKTRIWMCALTAAQDELSG
ncbi:PSP1-domain-containing protein [Hesseltinella vesiculosa]|uniref:PSP1-domain-containing protein n=1 Tax=Hesseltinella vesiculosa TaxID=101127 RepID=A0A1X2GQV4_9FUNG|nr:PSP1-domain-containing protein [Hesseltinella vesiculosa]